ncbi:MAG: hypothetical protein ABEI98_11600 [Halorhabdus sp.]
MTTRAIERVEDWETRSFGGGYRDLQELADGEFSGVVRSPAGTLCMLNGTVVGILDGRIEDFEDADGTAYEAPTPALPLLIVMQDRADEVRAKYYTEDTPLSKVDSTLADGGFTGFIELSENVLSGDYYVVYHSGRSMSVAFIGNSGQLLSEDEAFERADDEVGIYKVRPVDIEPIDIPEPEPTTTDIEESEDDEKETSEQSTDEERADQPTERESGTPGGTVTRDDGETDGPVREQTSAKTGSPDEENDTEQSTDRPTAAGDAARGGTQTADWETNASGGGPPTAEQGAEASDGGPGATGTTQARSEAARETGDQESPQARTETAEESAEPTTDSTPDRAQAATANERESSTADSARQSSTDRQESTQVAGQTAERATNTPARGSGTESSADLETRTIPSLDPDRTWSAQSNETAASTPTAPSPTRSKAEPNDKPRPSAGSETSQTHAESTPDGAGQSEETTLESTPTDSGTTETAHRSEARVNELEETIADREERIESLETRLENVTQERDDIATERDELRAERDEIATERDELQAELQQAREELADLREQRDTLQSRLEQADTDGVAAETSLSRQEAMDGTDLFVRYDSKGEPTLQTAHDSGASRSEVNENLNVEFHTQFETDGAVVAGQPFDTFLRNTIEFRFVSWLVRQLLFEIRDTGHKTALSDLYDSIPLIDRAELNGEASVEYTEEGQTKRSQEEFDVVLRDRMGNPLVVANFNDTRKAATEDDMRSLVTAATRVGESNDTLAGAMYVTASFFEPEALETADESTGGGLLSRDKRESFVKVSRKRGYHLCLVEARDEQFHMAVPEL